MRSTKPRGQGALKPFWNPTGKPLYGQVIPEKHMHSHARGMGALKQIVQGVAMAS